ncbi:MAG: hypothetical protein F6J86_34970 [Symploca sp. SIO1B1]|nr:hypothetical protein [Symploca sp. SIO1B1]
MEFLTSIVDLDSIQVKSLSFNSAHKVTQIEALANTIIDLGGLVNVPVVEQVNVDNYELISGYLEYYAYIKACELNPSLPDRITVFISNTKNREAIRNQLEVLQVIEDTPQNLSQPTHINKSEVNLQIKNLESCINNKYKLVFAELERQKAEILSVIEGRLPQPIPPMDAFNRILEPEIALQIQRKLEFMGTSKARKIVAQLQEVSKRANHKPFQSFTEISETLKEKQKNRSVRLISEKNMLKFIDRWND